MFGDVLTHSGCIRSRRPYCGMSYECVWVSSELILCQDPIILPLTEILTVPVRRKRSSTMSRADRDHETMLKKNLIASILRLPLYQYPLLVDITLAHTMSLLLDLEAEIIDYAKAMPETGNAEDLDFEVWGKGFCERMVGLSRIVRCFIR
jgi:hypothetical protein